MVGRLVLLDNHSVLRLRVEVRPRHHHRRAWAPVVKWLARG